MKLKLNHKAYDVPELTFKHFTIMEEQGFSIIEAFQKGQMMLCAMGFVCAVVGCNREKAEHLIEQHVLGGGKLQDIINAFSQAVNESDFFKKMLSMNEENAEMETEELETEEAER